MSTYSILAIVCYFSLLLVVAIFSYRRNQTATDYILGGRSMNYMLTALAAHASDMSSWIFMGYPAFILTGGLFHVWTAIGLLVFMFLNWQLIAPKVRIATETFNSLTFSSFFEHRFADMSGTIRVFTAIMSLFFYTVYISAGLVGLGLLLENLFGLDYTIGIIIGCLIVIPYVFSGGYVTLAWIDLYQGIFLLGVILFVPLYVLPHVGGWSSMTQAARMQHLPLTLFPDFQPQTWVNILEMALGWGLGYFGQPHIITKFMGIKNVGEINKAKWVGMTWMFLAITGATLVGLVGIVFFSGGIDQDQKVFINMVQDSFPPFVVGFLLCSILAATINAMGSQILVLTSNLTEDIYKKLVRKKASSRELLIVARVGVVVIALVSFFIAFAKLRSIYALVLYSWSGLGASFGPLLLLSLYSKKINKYGAWCGILSGGIVAAVWPYINDFMRYPIPSLLPAFSISFILILLASRFSRKMVYSKK